MAESMKEKQSIASFKNNKTSEAERKNSGRGRNSRNRDKKQRGNNTEGLA